MYNANTNNVFVPSKIVSVKPENQTNYSTKKNNQIRWNIPSYIGFCDPTQIKFQCRAKMVTEDGSEPRGTLHPDGSAGIWSCIRDMRVTEGTGRTELEMISDLNVQTANSWQFTQNDSINAKRELFEGLSANANLDNQLWYSEQPDWYNTTITTSAHAIENKISARIPCSGIIGEKATNVFPLTATSGLRVTMNLEEFERSMTLANRLGAGVAADWPASAGGAGAAGSVYANVKDTFYITYTSLATTPGTNDQVVDTTTGTGNDGLFDIEIALTTDRAAGAKANLADFACIDAKNDNNFVVGDLICICKDDGTFPQCLGKIYQIEKNANRCKISYQANRANGNGLNDTTLGTVTNGYIGCDAGGNTGDSVVFFVAEDRKNRISLANTKDARDNGTDVLPACDIQITDCELSVLQVQPPAGYVENMLKKVNGTGVEMDYCTSTLYRGNIVNAQGMTSSLIPANVSRAYSLLSVPLTQKSQNSLIESSLLARYENEKSYQWSLDGTLVPDRPIELTKYAHNKNPVLHIMENEKAMENAKYTVRNLWNTQDRLLFGRALSRYGQVHDLQGKTTMLRVTYPNTPGETVMLNNNVVHLNRMLIQADGVVVQR